MQRLVTRLFQTQRKVVRLFSLNDFDATPYSSENRGYNKRPRRDDSFKDNIDSDSLLSFHSILNPKSLKDIESFLSNCNGNIPRQSLQIFLKIFTHTLKKETRFNAQRFMAQSNIKDQIINILQQINEQGIDAEYSSFLALMQAFDSLGLSLNYFGIQLQDWERFNQLIKERIQNENYDLRSLIKILNASSNKFIYTSFHNELFEVLLKELQNDQEVDRLEPYHLVRVY